MKLGPETTVWESPTKRTRVVEFGYTPEGGTEKQWVGLRMSRAVAVYATTEEGSLLMVSQPRPVIGDAEYLELPAGLIDGSESPRTAAKRELREETGYTAKTWTYLGKIRTSPGLIDEAVYLFSAAGLTQVGDDQDENERITVKHVSLTDLGILITAGKITDCKTICANAMVSLKFVNGGTPDGH